VPLAITRTLRRAEVELRAGLAVGLERGERPAARQARDGGLSPGGERLLERLRQRVRRACSSERVDGVVALAGRQRVCDVLQRARHLPQDRLRRRAHQTERVDRQDHEAEQQRARRADEDVDAAGEAEALGLLEDHHEHRGDAGLGDHRGAAAEQDGGGHRQRHDHDQLPGAAADQVDQQVADEDAQGDAERGLERSAPSLSCTQPEHQQRADRREERAAMAHHFGRDEPCKGGCKRSLSEIGRRGPQPLQSHLNPVGHLADRRARPTGVRGVGRRETFTTEGAPC